jgi:hypothetical protein
MLVWWRLAEWVLDRTFDWRCGGYRPVFTGIANAVDALGFFPRNRAVLPEETDLPERIPWSEQNTLADLGKFVHKHFLIFLLR